MMGIKCELAMYKANTLTAKLYLQLLKFVLNWLTNHISVDKANRGERLYHVGELVPLEVYLNHVGRLFPDTADLYQQGRSPSGKAQEHL